MAAKSEATAALKRHQTGSEFSRDVAALPRASVLVPLLLRDGELRVLMTLRSQQLRTNAGDVCFPGGKSDPGDEDEVATALREAEEEIGLPAEQVEVVCRLYPIISKGGLLVTPVVGFIDESFRPSPNPSEVSAVFTVPLDFFARRKHHTGFPGPHHHFHYRDPESGRRFQIWGLTATVAVLVTVLALEKNPEFDIGFDFRDPSSFFQQRLNRRISKL